VGKRTKIEQGSGNVFADIGLPDPEEALAKAEVARQINRIIADRELTQLQAADVLGIGQPRVSELKRGRLAVFSLEKLIDFAKRLGNEVKISITPSPRPAVKVLTATAQGSASSIGSLSRGRSLAESKTVHLRSLKVSGVQQNVAGTTGAAVYISRAFVDRPLIRQFVRIGAGQGHSISRSARNELRSPEFTISAGLDQYPVFGRMPQTDNAQAPIHRNT
jgi:predicted XRE-type DNA-binding protein